VALGVLPPVELLDAERVDRTIKGVEKGDPWLALERLVARLAGVKVASVA